MQIAAIKPGGLTFIWAGLVMFLGPNMAFAQTDIQADPPAVQISFSGWGVQNTIKAGKLKFSGFGVNATIKPGQISFAGLGSQDVVQGTIKAGLLKFVGWGDKDEIEVGAITFQGWGTNSIIEIGAITFTGRGNSDNVQAGRISFQGCGHMDNMEKKPHQAALGGTLSPPGPIQALPMEGNWMIKWEGAKRDGAFATLVKNLKWGCEKTKDGCWSRFSRNDKEDWTVSLLIPGEIWSGGHVKFLDDDRISVSYRNGLLGDWKAESSGRGTKEKVSGRWAYGEQSGGETWTRVRSHLSFVQANNGKKLPYGTPLSLGAPYSGPGNDMRGNRPWQKISVYGDNLWGLHRWWIPKESGIEITNITYHCKDGDFFGFYGVYTMCLEQGGVQSIEFTLTFWPQARPGLNVFYFDDKEIPFNLDLPGYPRRVTCG